MANVVASISFFVNAGIRFVEETCKMRAFTQMWDRHQPPSATASPTPRPAASATACRSTASGSPRRSPRTTCSASCSRRSASRCPRTPGPARCSCRRGTRRSACPALGPAVVAAHPAGAGLRDRPARVRRPLRRLEGHRGQDRRAGRRGPGRARRRAGPGRRVRGHRGAQGPAGREPRRAHAPHRVAATSQVVGVNCVHRDGAVAARRRRQHPEGRPRRAEARRSPSWPSGGPTATTTP